MTRVERAIAALLLAAAPARGGAAAAPDPGALLVAALSAPTTGYQARGRIQSFAPGQKPKALGMTVYFMPGSGLRREVRVRAGLPPEQVFIDDGRRRRLYWPKLRQLWTAEMPRESAARRAERLTSLYRMSASPGGRVAGLATWRLDLRAPDGALRRALWIGRASGLLLKCEEYRRDGTLLRRERLTALTAGSPDPALFRLDVPPGTSQAPMNAPSGPAEPGAAFPGWIPDGFLALEARVEGPGRTLAVDYGDGVETFTLRQGPGAEPDGGEKSGRPARLEDGGRASLSFGKDGPLLEFRSRGRAFSITGGITEDEMLRVADSIPEAAP